MHYHKSKFLRFANAAFEFLLLILTFILAGWLRSYTPMGSQFFMWDIWTFLPLSALYALVIVGCNAVLGSYRTLHLRNSIKQLFLIALTSLMGLALMATAFYVFRVSQLSRLLLVYYYLLSVIMIYLKRLVFDRLADAYVRKHDIVPRALLIGGGQLAHRFFRDVIEGRGSTAMQYVGYLDAAPREGLPAYLGTVDSLYELLQTHKVDMIVLDVATTQRIMMLADNFHLRVAAVPVYNDYVSSRTEISTLGGMRFVDLRLLNTCEIMGVNIVVTDMEKTVRLLEEKLEDWRGKYICVALPDGGPLSKFSREQGYVDAARVTGPDLMKEMLKESADKHYRHYFYGSTQETLDILKATIEKNYPGAVIAGMYSPPFRPLTPEEDAAVIRRINETKPDFVWVGLGAPKQERWMAAHEDKVQAVMVGVGAAFDYEAGNIRRAPMWMQRHNLEWLYRLMQDPKRLFKRYLTTNIKYLWWTWKQ